MSKRRLIQIHWQYRGREETEFVAQREIVSPDGLRSLMRDLWQSYPPPEEAIFVLHTEESPHFIRTIKEIATEGEA